ncbi:hypothetical protein [uncultured Draconibacterium sp.]|uniref:hypothetical protein n=1 Tax=uncultured Draconibacterium sp. TaxID=1573823 RepID=UPI0032172942
MDDIIVIILTLLVAVFGALNQQRKKKAAQNAAPNQSKQPTGFWDMIMDDQAVQEEIIPEYDDQPTVVEEYTEPEVRPKYEFVPSSEASSGIKEEMKAVVKEKSGVSIEGEKFSLRKAVIYNEILNRKYT